MRLLSHSVLPLVLLIALPGVGEAAWAQSVAQENPPPQRQADPPSRPNRSSLSDSVRRAQRETGGQILGAEQVPFEGRNITRVKYMDDRGRVRYMDYTGDPGTAQRGQPRRADNDER